MSTISKSLAFLLLTALFTVMMLSFIGFSLVTKDHVHAVDTNDCPLMSHHDSPCLMTMSDHIAILHTIFETLLPTIVSLVLLLGVLIVLPRNYPDFYRLRFRWRIFIRWLTQITYTFTQRRFQDLFANGILNPKLF